MYTKGAVLELQFAAARLNDGAGEPFWIDLSREEATRLLQVLQARLASDVSENAPPAVVNLDGDEPAQRGAGQGMQPHAQGGTDAQDLAPSDGPRQWICIICGWVYDEAEGLPDEGIAPGTRWEDIPADWRCPECDVGKEDFAMVPL